MIYLNEIDLLDSNIRNWKFHGEIGSGYNQSILNEACVTADHLPGFPNKGSMPPMMISAQS